MDQLAALCCAISLVIFPLVCSTEFTNAKIVENQVANLSSSWNNYPTTVLNTSLDDGLIITPILHRGSNSTQFLCGFYCQNNQTCYFGVAIFQRIYDSGDGSWQPNDPKVIWTANGDRPVKYNATLELTQSGDMFLLNADGTLVWSTNTGGKSVAGLNLTEMGNLVLFNRSKAAVWQSFDHPTDSLVPGQVLLEGQKLTSSISTSDLNQGLYSLDVQLVDTLLGGQVPALLGYIKSNPLQIYYQSYLVKKPPLQFINGSFNGMTIPPASAAQFMKLESDGHLKVYEWGGPAGNNWKMVADLLTPAIGECGYPMACGRYGLCSNGQCTCLDEANNDTTTFFKQTDFRQPNLGCTLSSPISCNYSQDHRLLHLKDLTYFGVEPYLNTESYLYSEKTDLVNCKNKCLTNCSCQAAIFLYNQQYKRESCLILTEVFSVINKEQSNEDIQVFVKVRIPKRKVVSSFQPSLMVIVVSSIGGFIVICSTVGC